MPSTVSCRLAGTGAVPDVCSLPRVGSRVVETSYDDAVADDEATVDLQAQNNSGITGDAKLSTRAVGRVIRPMTLRLCRTCRAE